MKTKFNQSKLKLAIVSAMLLGTAAITVPAYADATPTDLKVSALVNMACTITTTHLAFGDYQPLLANKESDLQKQGGITTTCTNGSSGVIQLDNGIHAAGTQRNMVSLEDGTKYLKYDVKVGSYTGPAWNMESGEAYAGTGLAVDSVVWGVIPMAQNVIDGSYSDTLKVTIVY